MRIKSRIGRLFVSVAAASLLAGGLATVVSAPAQAATCKTVQLGPGALSVIRPYMSVPICYTGSQVWQNGPVTGSVTAYGYTISYGWIGTYGGGSWLGAGMNYQATLWTGAVTFGCATRWGINTQGNVISYNRGC